MIDSSKFMENFSLTLLMDSSSSSGSQKRVRANQGNVQVPSCFVDGCVTDLGNCREYHRRHRVCEAHSTSISYGTQYFLISAVATSSWNEAVKANQNIFPSSFSQEYIRERQFPFLQTQPHLNNSNTTVGNSGSRQEPHTSVI